MGVYENDVLTSGSSASGASPTDVCPPPPLVHDLEFWGLLLQIVSLIGYVVADYDRGFVGTLGPATFIILAWVYLLSAILAYFARGQLLFGGISAQLVYPHLASELLNILGALCYCVSTSLYTVKASDDAGAVAGLILFAEYVAALIGFVGSLVYFRSWEIDEEAHNAASESEALAKRAFFDGIGADVFDALELSEQQEATLTRLVQLRAAEIASTAAADADRLFGNVFKGIRRVYLRFFTLDLHSQIWNVVPSLIYLISAGIGLWLHFVGNPRAFAANAGDTPRLLKLDALRVMSQGYLLGDVLFFVDAVIAIFAWRYNRTERLIVTTDVQVASLVASLHDIRN